MIVKYYKIEKATANRNNFYKETVATFTPSKTPNRQPDYISESGSKYWYEIDGVIRQSDHWGSRVASCEWFYGELWNSGSELLTGYCAWKDFEKTELVTVEAEAKRVYKNGFALLETGEKVRTIA